MRASPATARLAEPETISQASVAMEPAPNPFVLPSGTTGIEGPRRRGYRALPTRLRPMQGRGALVS